MLLGGGAGGNPLGGEFLVNSHTDDDQQGPAVAMASDGRFVVVWHSDNQDGDRTGVYGQRFDASGNPQGGEFQVNVQVEGHQASPAAAMADDGSFVVVWASLQGDGIDLDRNIYMQRFDSLGNPLGVGP